MSDPPTASRSPTAMHARLKCVVMGPGGWGLGAGGWELG
jgi:hypothetical protein